jgi:hypothetical protein
MPVLSEDSLRKRFACGECGKTFRTRQGLSGHLRFKHGFVPPGPVLKNADASANNTPAEVMLGLAQFVKLAPGFEITQSEIDEFKRISDLWLKTSLKLTLFGLTPDERDFKSFVIASYAASGQISSLINNHLIPIEIGLKALMDRAETK